MELMIVDAFVIPGRIFSGNPAAVCLLSPAAWPPERWLQAVAEEMNLSETAFVRPTSEADLFELRWFTPAAEVQLCGHATLASAHALVESGRVPVNRPIRFRLRWHGDIAVDPGPESTWTLGFPLQRCEARAAPAGLFESLGCDPQDVRWTGFGPYDWVVELRDPARVAEATPAFAALAAHEGRGVALCAAEGASGQEGPGRYVCRFFAPALRIAEDPVTGSLQCVLGPHFSARLGRSELEARQLSARGGQIGVGVDSAGGLVRLAGSATTVLRGALSHAALP